MSENTPSVEIVPSKFQVLKSKITREGLILGGITAGILIAGGYTLLKTKSEPEIMDVTLNETNVDTLNVTIEDKS
jgi:hypothetical protein